MSDTQKISGLKIEIMTGQWGDDSEPIPYFRVTVCRDGEWFIVMHPDYKAICYPANDLVAAVRDAATVAEWALTEGEEPE